MIVEVKDAEVTILTDEGGKDIVYTHNGEEFLLLKLIILWVRC